MNKYEIRTEQKKSAIIHAALALINKNGFSKASIKEIADLAKVSQVTIYNYFRSKDTLALECAKFVMKDNFQTAKNILHSELPFKEKLVSALSMCSHEMDRFMCEYFSASSLADEKFDHILADGIDDLRREVFVEYIEQGKKEHVIDASIPTSVILKYIDGFSTVKVSPHDYIDELEGLHHLFLYGLIGK